MKRLLLFIRGLYHGLTARRFWVAIGLSTVAHLILVLVYETHPGIDGVTYQRIARTLVETGNLFACGAFDGAYWPPLFCIYLGGLYTLFGEAQGLVMVLNVVTALAVTLVSLPYLRRIFGQAIALWSSLLFYNSMIVYFFTLYYKYELMTALFLGICLALLLADRERSPGRTFVAGLALGLAALATGRVLALVPPLLYWIAARPGAGGWRPILLQAVLFVGGLVIMVAPWTTRNYICFDRFVPITSNSGINFYMGFNEVADGSYRHNDKWPAPYDHTPKADNATFYQGGLDYIRAHPGRAVELILRKVNIMWRIHYFDSAFFYPFFWIAVFGLHRLLGRERRSQARTIQLLFLAYTLIHCLFIARYYYLLPLLPLIYAIALTGQRWLAGRLLGRFAPDSAVAQQSVD